MERTKVRVAIVGVGNCCNSFIQGLTYYRNADPETSVSGLMHVDLGGLHVSDIEVVAAFDVTADKVGKPLGEAIYAHPNDTIDFADRDEVAAMFSDVIVQRGMTLDGIGKYVSEVVTKSRRPVADVQQILKDTGADVIVSWLPVGSEDATKWYVEQALAAGVSYVNAMPVFIGRETYWQARFSKAGLLVIGDDIKSQVGATITHRVLATLFNDRGVELQRTSQLNVGGNMDFLNMLERERLESKKISKTNAVTSIAGVELAAKDVHVGPSDYVPFLTDQKHAHIVLEGKAFGDVPLSLELKLEVWDSPNSAGVIIDAVRLAKLGQLAGVTGNLHEASSYLMKSPPQQIRDDLARLRLEKWIQAFAIEQLAPLEQERREDALADVARRD